MQKTVLFCGAWDDGPGYPRSRGLRQALESRGVRVLECRGEPLLKGADKRAVLRAPWRWPGLALRWFLSRRRFRALVVDAVAEHDADAVLVPYPGHLRVVEVARAVERPIVLDLFLSAYDTAVVDRGLFREGSVAARALRAMDRRACAAADLILMDTEEHARHVAELTGLARDVFDWVPIGDPDAPHSPAPYSPPDGVGPLEVLFFGTGVPLHGTDVLLQAVADTPGVRLTLVGGTAADRRTACDLGERVDLQPEFVSRQRLQELLDTSHVVAGVFGSSAKAQRVVPFKVVHGLASGRPVLTARTPAVERFLRDGEDAFFVPAGDSVELAERLRSLARERDALARVAAAARGAYERHFSPAAAGARLVGALERLWTEAEP